MKGEQHGRAKLRKADVIRIRKECRPGDHDGPHQMPNSIAGTARRYGISRKQVERILTGENWKE
jgi:hypothetical protein